MSAPSVLPIGAARQKQRRGRLAPVVLYRWSVEAHGEIPGAHLQHPRDAAEYVRDFLGAPDGREHFVGLYLDVQHHVIRCEELSVGTLTASVIHPRNLYRTALAEPGIDSVIIAHNHPSTDPTPSPEDQACTRQIHEAGEIIGVELIDHIIIADHTPDYFSFSEGGFL